MAGDRKTGKKPKDNKTYASAKSPTIEAAIDGLFRFQTPAQAEEKLTWIRESFIISTKDSGIDYVILWIKDFITSEEKVAGYTGNYAKISIQYLDGKYTLATEKMQRDKKFHPKRTREKHQHPNWGHPILRGIKKGKIYNTIEEAEKALADLHEEYPTVTIPSRTKLYTMIFSRDSKPAVQKYVLEIKLQPDGKFLIDNYLNTYKPEGKSKSKDVAEEKPESVTQGYFTSMVTMRNKKKGK